MKTGRVYKMCGVASKPDALGEQLQGVERDRDRHGGREQTFTYVFTEVVPQDSVVLWTHKHK